MPDEPIRVIEDDCVGCGLCVNACPYDAIVLDENEIARIDLERCTLCGACVEACKFDAIELKEKAGDADDLSAYRDVWVFAEQNDGKIESVTYELLGEGRKLADAKGGQLAVLVIGHETAAVHQTLAESAADKVLVCDAPVLKAYNAEIYASVIADVITAVDPGLASRSRHCLCPR